MWRMVRGVFTPWAEAHGYEHIAPLGQGENADNHFIYILSSLLLNHFQKLLLLPGHDGSILPLAILDEQVIRHREAAELHGVHPPDGMDFLDRDDLLPHKTARRDNQRTFGGNGVRCMHNLLDDHYQQQHEKQPQQSHLRPQGADGIRPEDDQQKVMVPGCSCLKNSVHSIKFCSQGSNFMN